MKCNVKRALEQEKKPYDAVEDFKQFMYRETKKDYFDKKTKTLNNDFFVSLCDIVSEINLGREESGLEKFINLDISEDYHTGIFIDDIYPVKEIVLKTPNDFIDLYVCLHTLVFKNYFDNGLWPL